MKSDFFPLGQTLQLQTSDLESIRTAYPSESEAEQALNDTVKLWLQRKYDVERFGRPTWRMLVQAVDHRTGGNNPELAKKIASDHPAIGTISSELHVCLTYQE